MASKAKKTARADKMHEKFSRIARIIGAPESAIEEVAKRTKQAFHSVGKAFTKPNGMVEIHARERVQLTFTNKKHVVTSKALVKDAVDCPVAKCAKDPDSCWLGAYATSVHVGNATLTFWSELCPNLVVKCMLPDVIRAAIRDWDNQVKRKQKNRRFRLADNTYFLGPYPPSLAPTHKKVTTNGKRGKNARHPTRRLTVRSDIALALMANPVIKRVQKPAAAKRARKAG